MNFTEWWRGLHGLAKFAIPFLAVIAAFSAASTAWVAMEWPVPATREWVRGEIARSDVRHREIATVVLGLAREQRERLRRVRDGHVSRLAVAKDQQVREDIQALIMQDDADIADVEARIAVLEKLR